MDNNTCAINEVDRWMQRMNSARHMVITISILYTLSDLNAIKMTETKTETKN